ncbi:ATP-dependent Clp protease adaptor ClpS [Frigoriflavimonas asaccharolytica]|uniref:ATP-dependent Clp protease adaptor protein ClpS n=1 Tax=Frigoriflavimonas asaccharolytica TaxID=2735899 RepID=A0A8J8K8H0_9FLAO|nr:ATP-dependent Clp protease adaptor ClpS [Frigoriflavimonas asaccharolytica]NRS91937.1 ATP-dependent Clp protease adaptor protein ClpS [Frigoriflavimonas asaccharolytica]
MNFLKNTLKNYENPSREYEEDVLVLEDTGLNKKLVVYNDDIHTFDYVIDSLIEVCKHTLEQAEQCTMLIHYKGKCTVKSASMDVLLPMHEKLLSKSLTSEIF